MNLIIDFRIDSFRSFIKTNDIILSVTNSEHNCAHVSTFGTIVAQKMSEKLQNEHNFINLHWSKKNIFTYLFGGKIKK